MNKKTIGLIMMIVGGIVTVVTLGLLIKWYPIQVGIIVAGIGFGGYTVYKKA
jgi:small-conductance mechanosensitive channel